MTVHEPVESSGDGRPGKWWVVAAICLAAITIAGGTVIWTGHGDGRELEISTAPEEQFSGQIVVSGEVNNPGLYPLSAGDTVADILQAAGGETANADTDRLELDVPGQGQTDIPQKVDINRAEAWLLAALPGIGEARAQAIVDYRRQHGPFRDINELLKVPGMGDVIFENIKNLITVSE
jgi:competence protein ComEA